MADIEKGKAKGKKRRRSARVYINVHKPVNPEAAALIGDFPDDDDDSSQKSYLGDPYPAQTFADRRVSEPLTAGRASPSVSDHGVGQGRNPGLAAHHPNLRQGDTSITPFANARSNDPTFIGNEALAAAQRIARPFATQEPHDVAVDRLNLPMMPQVRAVPSGDPTSRRPAHTAPINPGPQAMKASDRVAVIRQAMYGHGAR